MFSQSWALLAKRDDFPFPDYKGEKMTIHDACPTRKKTKVHAFMKKRADSMPLENVVVYCTSCTKALANGGKTPRYLVDLLLGEETYPGDTDPDIWHEQLNDYISKH